MSERFRYVRERIRGILRPRVRVSEAPAEVLREWDVPVAVRDGTLLRVNVFRPRNADGAVPAILSAHPYGKDALPRRGRGGRWRVSGQYRALRQTGTVEFSELTSWEAPDPAWWVAHGYAVVNCDLRGCGTSEGTGDLLTAQEADDCHDLVEWAAAQTWCSGRVGMLGVSYLAISQYGTAATRPPHLAAICPWEGMSDPYRDLMRPGGIREDGFVRIWSRGLRRDRLATDVRREQRARELRDDWWEARTPDLERIDVPMLVCGSFSDHNLHTRGSFRAFERVGSERRWLYTHRGGKWATFYSPEALEAQRRFLDCFLKGEDDGMLATPPVRLEIRSDRDTIADVRDEAAWPLPGTEWTPLALGADGTLVPPVGGIERAGGEPGAARDPGAREAGRGEPSGGAPDARGKPRAAGNPSAREDGRTGDGRTGPVAGAIAFDVRSGHAAFRWPIARRVELSGPMALRLHMSVEGADDVDLHVQVRKLRGGRPVPFEGSYGYGLDGVTTGWLRASHRELDEERSRPFEPVHRHRRRQPLAAGEVVAVDIALLPSATLFEAGDQLELAVHGRWPKPRNPITGAFPAAYERRRRGTCTLHCGGPHDARLLVPVIPADRRPA